jgi:Icc-related predicted phosphoesterase
VADIALTPGNHDFVFQRHPFTPTPERVHLLIDKGATLHGLRVYGSPWCPRFGGWAFMLEEDALEEKFSKIPEGLDVLITHGPAYGVCDEILLPKWPGHGGDPHLGSTALRARIESVKPKWHFCGHIHTGDHKPKNVIPDVASANVSILDEGYARIYDPLEFSVFREEDEV